MELGTVQVCDEIGSTIVLSIIVETFTYVYLKATILRSNFLCKNAFAFSNVSSFYTSTLPDNTLLSQILIYIRRSNNYSQHYTLSSYIYGKKKCLSHLDSLDKQALKISNYSTDKAVSVKNAPSVTLHSLDPIL